MITLYGFPLSNYYNKVKLSLLEKGVPFVEELARPSQDAALLEKSPTGKIPFIKRSDAEGYLIESQAIVEYIEAIGPKENRLLPEDPWEAAQCRSIMFLIDFSIDSPCRPVLPAALLGQKAVPEQVASAEQSVARGVSGLRRLAKFKPYIAGSELTYADLAAITVMPVASVVLKMITGKDPLEDWPELHSYFALLRQRPHVQRVEAEATQALQAFLAMQKKQ
ncbi:glutathione transferase [Sorangium cellulosum]|uniref:Glutathione transferase n=1 Tax=Sorangium cellulosum TaxID=56 RepID=A0A2L0ELM9_SORCE|nr:glutathione S-transferase family protein [Sorangium cellulosum]AUX40199.1 glutathione transferase [Sorangium cellulosum]